MDAPSPSRAPLQGATSAGLQTIYNQLFCQNTQVEITQEKFSQEKFSRRKSRIFQLRKYRYSRDVFFWGGWYLKSPSTLAPEAQSPRLISPEGLLDGNSSEDILLGDDLLGDHHLGEKASIYIQIDSAILQGKLWKNQEKCYGLLRSTRPAAPNHPPTSDI